MTANTPSPKTRLRRALIPVVALAAAWWFNTNPILHAADDSRDADAAWTELQTANKPRPHPAAWNTKAPSETELKAFYQEQIPHVLSVADLARDFYRTFPEDDRATEAKQTEHMLLGVVRKMGGQPDVARVVAIENEMIADESLSLEERMGMAYNAFQRPLMTASRENIGEALVEMRAAYLKFRETFPEADDGVQLLMELNNYLMQYGDQDERRALLESQATESTPEKIRMLAKDELGKFDLLGKPLDMAFTAIDGSKVDLADLKGKVVLISYWATWCPPCVQGIPTLQAAYDKFHDRGFEILGISLDYQKEKLTNFLREGDIKWPHFYDEENEANRFAEQYGIVATPTYWLVDKKGNLRSLAVNTARLDDEVAKLLAE